MKTLFLFSTILIVIFSRCSNLAPNNSENTNSKCRACHEVPAMDRVHEAHTIRQHFDCSVCHPGTIRNTDGIVTPDEATHTNGIVNIAIAAPYDSSHSANYNPITKTCVSVYCHGNFASGTHATINVNDSINLLGCRSCHNIDKMTSNGHHPHYPGNAPDAISDSVALYCGNCHSGYKLQTPSAVNLLTHIDGQVGPINNNGCVQCHAAEVPPVTNTHPGTLTQCSFCHK